MDTGHAPQFPFALSLHFPHLHHLPHPPPFPDYDSCRPSHLPYYSYLLRVLHLSHCPHLPHAPRLHSPLHLPYFPISSIYLILPILPFFPFFQWGPSSSVSLSHLHPNEHRCLGCFGCSVVRIGSMGIVLKATSCQFNACRLPNVSLNSVAVPRRVGIASA